MLTLHNLKTSPGAKKSKRRVGRGNASGKGNYAGRGNKGQRARSGGKNRSSLRSVKTYLQRIPKRRGFNSLVSKPAIVNLNQLNNNFHDGDEVTPKKLLEKNLIKSFAQGVKILGDGALSKKLKVSVHYFSKTAKDAILKSGGTAEIYRSGSKIKAGKK